MHINLLSLKRFDTIPEFMDGKNVMDFFDADIEKRLEAIEMEEAELEARGAYGKKIYTSIVLFILLNFFFNY